MLVCCATTFQKTKQPAGILNKLDQVDTLVYLLMSTCYTTAFWTDSKPQERYGKMRLMHFVDARAELSVIQDLGEKFANSEPDALKQQHFLPQSKGCRLLVYSTTEVPNQSPTSSEARKQKSIAHLICHLDSMLKNRTLCLTRNRSYKLKTNSLSFNFRWVCG